MKRAIILGGFDLTHYGHYRKFKQLKDMGYHTIAGVTTDKFAESYKRKPILNLNERMENMRMCKYVDEVIVNLGGHDSKDDILFSEADTIVRGGDWSEEDYFKQVGLTKEWVDEHGMTVITLPYTKGVSTSDILRRTKNGSINK